MTDLRQAAQQALEALENSSPDQYPEDAGVFYHAKDALRTALEQQQAEPDRRDLQAACIHPAPCARHCEAKAFAIEIRSLKSRLRPQAEPAHGDIRALKYRIHELEGEVMGYKRMLDVAEAASQRKPLSNEEIKEAAPAYAVDDFLDFNAGVRFAEAAHGIKEGT